MADPVAVRVARWALASSLLAPLALIGGWTVAASLQPSGYSAVHQTISALAAHGARDRIVMTLGLLVLGLGHLVTAAGLRSARSTGRTALALGGLATVAVAAFPQPAHGSAPAHITAATIGFIALALWPSLSSRPGASALLAPWAGRVATVVLLGLLIWFGAVFTGADVGLAERVLAGAEALWPLAVVIDALVRQVRT